MLTKLINILIYKLVSNRIFYILLYILYIQFLFYILGSPISCMDSESNINTVEVLASNEHPEAYSKEEQIADIKATGDNFRTVTKTVAATAAAAAVANIISGDGDIVVPALVCAGATTATSVISLVENQAIHSIENTQEIISPDRPISPSDFDTLHKSAMIDIESIIAWIENQDDRTKLLCYSIILLIISILLYLNLQIKNKIHNKINKLLGDNLLSKIISFLNSNLNIVITITILWFIIIAIIGIIFVVF